MASWHLLLKITTIEQEITSEPLNIMAFPDAQSLRMPGSKEHGVKSATQIIEAKHTTWIWKSI